MNDKEILLEKGRELFSTQSYGSTGIREIARSVGLSPGSFHYHFKNKEEFTIAILDSWFKTQMMPKGNKILFDFNKRAKEKLINYFQIMIDYHIENTKRLNAYSTCIMGNLGQELANENEAIIGRIKTMYKGVIFGIQSLITLGQVDGSINRKLKIKPVSQFIFDAYEGALLRRKIEKSNKPLENFIKTLETIL